MIKDCSLEEKHKDSVRQQIRDQVNERKKDFREEKAAWHAMLSGLSEKEKKALDELKCVKYYPKNTVPDLSQVKVPAFSPLFVPFTMKFDRSPSPQSNFINRYYGKADELL